MTEEKEKHTRSTLLGFFSLQAPAVHWILLERLLLAIWTLFVSDSGQILVHFSKVLFWIDV